MRRLLAAVLLGAVVGLAVAVVLSARATGPCRIILGTGPVNAPISQLRICGPGPGLSIADAALDMCVAVAVTATTTAWFTRRRRVS
jgi:hypothetical protein